MMNLLENTRRYLEIVNKLSPIHTNTPVEVRRSRAKTKKTRLRKKISLEKIEDLQIVVRDGEQIPLRIYSPVGNGPFPIIIYYHGGGWVINDIETCDATCQQLSADTKSIVVSVGYRLAPENPFPIPVNDAYDAFLWTAENSSALGGIATEINVMGDSAGGNLATVVTIINKEHEGPVAIKSQVLLYPVTDLSFSTDSYHLFAEGYGLQKKDMEWFAKYYLQQQEDKTHPYVAPLKSDNLKDLPPAFIIVAENDVLRDEGIAYAQKLKDFDNRAHLYIAKGLVHSYFTKNDYFSKEIDETMEKIKGFLGR
ncbi:alpha/beta hydrolase [Ureibacillus chungkukjangi]|uniref:alpha/beta hydrolase n=1 Tax=Ureibacillus chungkukjangi TaxID=1202712 RepID=UPI0020409A18|nr:alpha/beta hydrolase [Ureibacillus chungkukjangi]MCM3388407.1 alpha/beta hydrolase [Ureibacillus chungkukjangi]